MKKIVIVDDNMLVADGIQKHLLTCDIDCTVGGVFYNAEPALEYIRDNGTDIVISDIKMPGYSGLELSDSVMRIDTSIKVILISAYSEFSQIKKALRLGVFDFIEKPVDYTELTVILKKAIHQQDHERHILEELEKNRPIVLQNLFFNLVNNFCHDPHEFLQARSEYLTLNPDLSRFWIVILHCDKLYYDRKIETGQEYLVYIMGITEVFKKSMEEALDTIYVLDENENQIFIMASSGNPDIVSCVSEAVNAVELSVYGKYFNFSAAIGTYVSSLEKIHSSYRSARRSLEKRFFYSDRKVFTPVRETLDDAETNYAVLEIEHRILDAISKRDRERVKEAIFSLQKVIADGNFSRNSVYYLVYEMLFLIISKMSDVSAEITPLQKHITNIFHDGNNINSVDTLCRLFEEFCLEVCSLAEMSVKTHHERICSNVTKYIDDHYSDADMNLNQIASFVNVNPSYLSTLFSSETGQGINEYITKKRMEVAKELIENTQLSMKSISQKAGYSNQYYFSARFKKYYGDTPMSYRK